MTPIQRWRLITRTHTHSLTYFCNSHASIRFVCPRDKKKKLSLCKSSKRVAKSVYVFFQSGASKHVAFCLRAKVAINTEPHKLCHRSTRLLRLLRTDGRTDKRTNSSVCLAASFIHSLRRLEVSGEISKFKLETSFCSDGGGNGGCFGSYIKKTSMLHSRKRRSYVITYTVSHTYI